MAWTNWGFDGTINEAQWSQMAGLLGNDYVAAGATDCVVTAVAGARSVSVAAGTLYGDGVVSVNSAPEVVAMTTPVNGQWYVIALRRTWATNVSALVAIAGATTSTSTPTAPPTSFPTLNTQPGVLTDQPIAWAWCNSANTNVVIYDIRKRAVKSIPAVVANAPERDAKYMTPTQGLQVWRDDLGAVETYFGLYNASTNPGGRDAAGWYTNTRNTVGTMVKPTSITAVTGTATIDAMGEVAYTNCTFIYINGLFSSKYKNYTIVFNNTFGNGNGTYFFRVTSGGVSSNAGYYNSGFRASAAGAVGTWNSGANADAMYLGEAQNAYNSGNVKGKIEIFDPYTSNATYIQSKMVGTGVVVPAGFNMFQMATGHDLGVRDGIAIGVTNGNMSGTISVYGWNN